MVTIDNLNFDELKLELAHGVDESNFLEFVRDTYPQAKYISVPDGRQLIYIDNNSPILGVAHLDTTMKPTHFGWGRHYSKMQDQCIFSPQVDDRLGAYTLLDLLPQVGIVCDILLSVGEEIGDPTSRFFRPAKRYNWMFQFDRKGTDAVHYQYQTEEWLNVLNTHFTGVNRGSYSDIHFMESLGICGVNVGTGYYDYTGAGAWASLDDLTSQVNKFKIFYEALKDIKFPFRPVVLTRRERKRNSRWEKLWTALLEKAA